MIRWILRSIITYLKEGSNKNFGNYKVLLSYCNCNNKIYWNFLPIVKTGKSFAVGIVKWDSWAPEMTQASKLGNFVCISCVQSWSSSFENFVLEYHRWTYFCKIFRLFFLHCSINIFTIVRSFAKTDGQDANHDDENEKDTTTYAPNENYIKACIWGTVRKASWDIEPVWTILTPGRLSVDFSSFCSCGFDGDFFRLTVYSDLIRFVQFYSCSGNLNLVSKYQWAIFWPENDLRFFFDILTGNSREWKRWIDKLWRRNHINLKIKKQ